MNPSSKNIKHKGVFVKTSLHSKDLDQDTNSLRIGNVPPLFEHRPDLISKVFYNKASMFWKIMAINNISDPFEGFNPGESIYLP